MRPFKNFKPTQFDTHIPVEGKEEWLILLSRNRDSDCLQESNFQVALNMLGGESDTVVVLRFGHWANGWFELILVQPDTPAHQVAQEIEGMLDNYPVLDEFDYSEREQEAADITWKNFPTQERIDYIRRHRIQFEFRSFADMLGCVRGSYFSGYASELLNG